MIAEGAAAIGARDPVVDYLKAIAIVAVALTHAVPGDLDSGQTPVGFWIALVSGFHVPMFLIVSGWLAHGEAPVAWRRVAARLGRILLPYFVAVGIVWMLGLVTFPDPRRFVFKIVTGAALGHYYFVPVIAFCTVLLPLLSRLSTEALIVTAFILTGMSEVFWVRPDWRASSALFWQIRDPFLQFHLGYFVLGMILARHRAGTTQVFKRDDPSRAVVASLMIAVFGVVAWTHPWIASHPFARTSYTLAVMALVTAVVPPGPTPPLIRFLSEATWTIFLYHLLALRAVEPLLPALSLISRLLVLTTVEVAFGAFVALGGRRLFRNRSRLLLGY
jgi:surface polysaccharide O-acyltransferase-like enzyme